MNIDELKSNISKVSKSMFLKDFVGISHGSISAKIQKNKILINKKNTLLDSINDNNLIEISSKQNYDWDIASEDSYIHLNIYKNIPEAKFVCYTMPPFITSYSLTHDYIIPKDFYGSFFFDNIEVYDVKDYESWLERADIEIAKALKTSKHNLVILRGYGVFAYSRELFKLPKAIGILEESCKILTFTKQQGHLVK